MNELVDLSKIADRAQRLAQLRTYVRSHPYDPDGWYMLHVELAKDGSGEASEVARQRAVAIDPGVAKRFTLIAERPAAGLPRVPGHDIVRLLHTHDSATLYEARGPAGERCLLRIMHGESNASTARIMERQQVGRAYDRCLAASRVVKTDTGAPVQVLPWTDALPLDAGTHRLLEPAQARAAVASLCAILEAPHRDGLIAGDLRPSSVFGVAQDPASLEILGLRRPLGGDFGTLAGDSARYRWYATEEGAAQLDRRTDIYGLGLLLWWLVCGGEPPTLGERLKQRLPATGDEELDRIIARCTRTSPAERYEDVAALRQELLARPPGSPQVGGWILGERIGGGSVADVHRATHADGRTAIVKVFARRLNHERELAALRRADCEGVIGLVDASTGGEEPRYVALAVGRGEPLSSLVAGGPVPAATAVAIVRRLAATLAELHARGVIHRDLKPDNVLVEPGAPPVVTLLDFDTAKLDERPDLDEDELIGTPSHMSPEQWSEPRSVDARADVYGLGLIWFECLTGKHPLAGGSFADWQRAHLDPDRPAIAPGELRDHHRALLGSMLARDRERRPDSMAAVIAALDAEPPQVEAPAAEPGPPVAEPTPPVVEPTPRRSRVAIAAIGGALIFGGGLVAARYLWQPAPALRLADASLPEVPPDARPDSVPGPRPDAAVELADPHVRYAVSVHDAATEGPSDALVTMVVASEYLCPHCARVLPTLIELRRRYRDDLRLVHRQFVVHPDKATTSALAICAATKQDQFAAFDRALWGLFFRRGESAAPDRPPPFGLSVEPGETASCWQLARGCTVMLELARSLSLDLPRFQRDMRRCEPEVQQFRAELQRLGVRGVPAFFINGRFQSGARELQRLAEIIDEELALARARVRGGTPRADYYRTWVLERGRTSAP